MFRSLDLRCPFSRRTAPRSLAGLAALTVWLLVVVASSASAGLPVPTFSKAFNQATIGPGSVSTLTFSISNAASPTPVSNLAFTDVLPAGVVLATPAFATTTCTNGILGAPDGGSTITFTDGQLTAGAACTVSVVVTSATPGVHSNVSGDLTSSAGNSGPATADLTVDATRPGFRKAFSPASINPGATSTLIFTLDNTASVLSADLASFADTLPTGLVVASPANATTTCTGGILPPTLSAAPGGSAISLNFGFVGAGATCTVSVDVTTAVAASHRNLTGNLNTNRGASGSAAAVLVVARQFAEKKFLDDPVAPGGTVTLQFTITNFDRLDAASGITFTDDLTAVLSGLTAVGLPLANPCGPGSSLSGTTLLTLSGGNLDPEESCTFSVSLQVPAAAAAGLYPNVTSSVSYALGGVPTTADPATDHLVVSPIPLLTKSFTDDPVAAGGTVTLEFTITNTDTTGPLTALTFSDDLDAMLPGLVPTLPAAGFCGAGSTITTTTALPPVGDLQLLVQGANLAAGASCTFSVSLAVPAVAQPGLYFNTTSTISGTTGGGPVVGAPASDTLAIAGAPALEKSFLPDTVAAGGIAALQFTLTLNESAPGAATGISFTDDLGAVLAGLTALGTPLNDVCGVGSQLTGTTLLSLSGASLAPGELCTFGVNVQVPVGASSGTYTNTTSTVASTMLGLPSTSAAASSDLTVANLSLSKAFTDDPSFAGGTVTLQFTLQNSSSSADATGITFTDNLTAVLSGLAALGLPASDVCGTGSQLAGTTTLTLTGGNLLAGTSCTFSVTLQVPVAATPGEYLNTTSAVGATLGGSPVTVPGASDTLLLVDPLSIAKSFTNDPAVPGSTVNLQFTITNSNPAQAATGITFTDDLDAALSGLVAVGLPVANVCGAGSQISGTSLLTLTGGTLGPASSCIFSVTLQVPAGAAPGTSALNTTSTVTGTLGGVGAVGAPATDTLVIQPLTFSKAFDGPSAPTGQPVLSFTLTNLDTGAGAADLSFTDDLGAVLPGLVAVGLPAANVCGAGSQIAGTSVLTLTSGSLAAGASCTFMVTLQVPGGATPGTYTNTTSVLVAGGLPQAPPATAMLDIEPPPTFAKTFTPDSIGLNGVSTLSFLVDNAASIIAAGSLAFSDNLPAGLVVANPANASSTCGGTVTATPGAGVVSLSGGSVGAGATCLVQATVTATAVGNLVNTTGSLTSTSGDSGTASDTLTVNPQPGFAKAFAPAAIPAGGVSTLTFTIDNSASTVAASSLVFVDNLPTGVVVATPANATTTCTGGTLTATAGSGSVDYNGGSVPAGASCSVQVDVTSSVKGLATNISGALTSSLGSSGTAMADLTVVGDPLSLAKRFVGNPVLRGGTIELEFTVVNASGVVTVTGITFSDDLGTAIPGLVAMGLPVNDVCGAGSQLSGTTVVTLTGGSLAPGASCVFSVPVLVPAAAALGVFTNTTGAVSGVASGVPVSGPPAPANLEVVFLDFQKAFAEPLVDSGDQVVLSFTLTNPDPLNTASAISFSDDLDAFVPGAVAVGLPVNDVCGFGSQLAGTSVVTLTGGSLAGGASCTFDVVVAIPLATVSGVYSNVTSVVSAEVSGQTVAGDAAGAAQADLEVQTVAGVQIPTLDTLGLALFGLLLLGLGLVVLRRRAGLRLG